MNHHFQKLRKQKGKSPYQLYKSFCRMAVKAKVYYNRPFPEFLTEYGKFLVTINHGKTAKV